MKRAFSLLILILIIFGCGKKKSPTGGKNDTINPKIIMINPEEFSDISISKKIEISFSKHMDKKSFNNGLYIYPPILDKKIKWKNDTAIITFRDSLENNCNYYFNFTDRIKGWHFNPLDKNYLYVYKKGSLQKNQIAGKISFEDSKDEKYPIFLNLLTADSIFIFKENLLLKNYSLNFLNKEKYTIRIFVDKNDNDDYDFIKEPFCEKQSKILKKQEINFKLVYADTSKPKIKNIKVTDQNHLKINFSEDIQLLKNIRIVTNDSLSIKKNITKLWMGKDEIKVLCEPLDTLKYVLKIDSISDMKNNLNRLISEPFIGVSIKDTLAPEIIGVYPRNGSVVNSLRPTINIAFSEIILDRDLYVLLNSNENEKFIDVELIKSDGINFMFIPKEKLTNYTSYKFTILKKTKDYSNNQIEDDYSINFIPIKQ